MDFGIEGPHIDGTWYNPKTGDSFTVRDSYFQDNQLLIAAIDGRVFDYNTIQEYIKSDKPIQKQTPKPKTIPTEIENMLESSYSNDNMLDDDLKLIQGFNNTPTTLPTPPPTIIEDNEDLKLIKRVLKRVEAPSINVKVDFKVFPERQLDCLINMMGVDIEDIANYFINSISLEDIKESISKQIDKTIRNKFDTIEVIETPTENKRRKATKK